jgi:phosphocarrier protein HPr
MQRAVVVAVAEGLHARPAALFARAAAAQPVPVTIARPGGDPVDAASILAVMTLGVDAGEEVVLATADDGDAASRALDALATFLERTTVS